MLVDATLDPVEIPEPAGEDIPGAGDRLYIVRQVTWAGLDFCDSMVEGLTFAFLDGADGIVDLAGDAAIGVMVAQWWSSCRQRPTRHRRLR